MCEEFHSEVKLIFIRFVNKSPQGNKYIGFEIKNEKEFIFNILLSTIADFTMHKSYSTIFCKTLEGKLFVKRYLNRR